MYSMIIADDEELIREGMRDVVDWGKYGIEIAGTASNGKEAISLMERKTCDILLADIRMPVMDGLELTRAVKEKYPGTKVVILTAHDDFHYAQEAIKAGAIDYILKIGGEDELVSSISNIIKIILKEREAEHNYLMLERKVNESIPVLKENFLKRLLETEQNHSKVIFSQLEELGINLSDRHFQVIVIEVDDFYMMQNTYSREEINNFLGEIVEKAGEALCKEDVQGEAFVNNGDKVVLILNPPEEENEDRKKHQIKSLCKKIKVNTKGIIGPQTLSVGIGKACKHVIDIRRSFEEARMANESRFFYGKNSVIYIDEIPEFTENSYEYPISLEARLITDIQMGNREMAESDIESFFTELLTNKKVLPSHFKKVCIELLVVITRLVADMEEKIDDAIGRQFIPYSEIERLETVSDVKSMVKGVILKVIDLTARKSATNGTKAVQAAKNYIDNYFKHNLSIKHLAEKVYMSPNYLAAIFKQYTGETIVDYINIVRTAKAGELLKSSTYKICNIAEMVGYQDPAYFSRIFKKYFEVSPAEYRGDKC